MSVSNPGPSYWVDSAESQGGIDTTTIKFVVGASNVVPSFPLPMSAEVTSVAKSNTTGQYDIVFNRACYQHAGFSGDNMQASFAADGACYAVPIAVDPAAGTMTVQFCKGSDGTAVYPAEGDTVTLVIRRQRGKTQ